jgi:ABC-2 type transport system ATP-binding protein
LRRVDKMAAILEVSNLRKDFKDFSLKDVSFTLERGYIMGFIGANGAGKTTTIKLIMNLLKKDGGKINVFGQDNVKYEKEIKNRVGIVFDESHYYEELTISQMKRMIAESTPINTTKFVFSFLIILTLQK